MYRALELSRALVFKIRVASFNRCDLCIESFVCSVSTESDTAHRNEAENEKDLMFSSV